MSGFEVTQRWIERVVVVAVAGELDMLTAPELADAVRAAASQHPVGLVVDLGEVTFLGSAGMNVLITADRDLAGSVRFGVVAEGPVTSRPLKLIGIDAIVALYPTLAEALRAVTSREISVGGRSVTLRSAIRRDVPEIVSLLAADEIGSTRDGFTTESDLVPYYTAFDAIAGDPAHVLLVAQFGEAVIGTMQLSVLPGLARRGALRAQIEAVRVNERFRGTGLGSALFEWAIETARSRGCTLIQLTSDKTRTRAHRFYEHLGFTASHEGFKLILDDA